MYLYVHVCISLPPSSNDPTAPPGFARHCDCQLVSQSRTNRQLVNTGKGGAGVTKTLSSIGSHGWDYLKTIHETIPRPYNYIIVYNFNRSTSHISTLLGVCWEWLCSMACTWMLDLPYPSTRWAYEESICTHYISILYTCTLYVAFVQLYQLLDM